MTMPRFPDMSTDLAPEEGVSRCVCGSKYWDRGDETGARPVCHSCGEPWRPVTIVPARTARAG